MQYKSLTKGFTLIEIIIGMVALSAAFALITSLLLPTSERGAAQIQEIRAAELGQSMLNEIFSKAFDHNSDMAGGLVRCGESGVSCTANLGFEGTETRATFNDVDDYHLMPVQVKDSLGNVLPRYTGFTMSISVCNVSNYTGSCSSATTFAKLVTITITTPLGNNVVFSRFKANF